ncbi:hypothetical protein [Rickettsiella endosymbiont of Dermanyssus gallinae]|uniref:hypothetical protein n=1 Tax=Rickettsiella endosymbiont of Dermanyssus gallinae TaxID=2856608 RepID=UPI001C52961C|nr:hypothetical protein [Rickettsiella endosymbiont of Dermanyssus gallinae]
MSKLPNGLTVKQTKLCQAYAIPPHNATQTAQPRLENTVTVNHAWKLEKLKQIVDTFLPAGSDFLEAKDVNSAIQAIAEMNKMQGHYAAEKHMNLNVAVDTDIEQLEKLIEKYRKDY